MSTILFTWELGGGLGHLVQMRPLVREMLHRGHRVSVTLRDLSRARQVLGADVPLFQAPVKAPLGRPAPNAIIFAHILLNCGYANFQELAAMVSAWGNLYRLLRPDLIVFDHSPTALLAARGIRAKKIIIGSGFCVPPDHSPLPNLKFESRPLDMAAGAAECDLAILNAGHGTTADMLLAARPILQIPIYLEQSLLARAVAENLGAAVCASPKDGQRVVGALDDLPHSPRFAHAAGQFAARHADDDADSHLERMIQRMEMLAGTPAHAQCARSA